MINTIADTSGLSKKNCIVVCSMNEQSVDFFRKYIGSNGLVLVDNEIPSWQKVSADRVYFSDIDGKIGFELIKLLDADLYLGRAMR